MNIPHTDLATQHGRIRERILGAIASVIDHGRFVLGDEVAEFEDRFAALCGARYAVGVSCGTDALMLALRVLDIGEGDEVITVPNSFVATASAIALVGARPVFVDVGDDYNMDPDLLEAAITPRTRAILPVHLTGRPADMDRITAVAQAHRLHVIEDCAQAVCAEYGGRPVGSLGDIGCFSLYPLKTLGACGDSGILVTNDLVLCERLKVLRNLGLQSRDECIVWSRNSRLDTLQAAILLVKLDYVKEWTERRRANALFYQQELGGLQAVQVPLDEPREKAAYHTFVIQADRRDELKSHLRTYGVETRVHYPVPIHLQPAAENLGYQPNSFPVAERQGRRILSLPVHSELTRDELRHVVYCISRFYGAKA